MQGATKRRHLRADADGEVTIALSGLDLPDGGAGTLALRSDRQVPSRWLSRGRPRCVSFGTRAFTVAGGGPTTVTLHLSRDNLALLRRMQTITVVLRATVTGADGRATTVSQLASLHAPPNDAAR